MTTQVLANKFEVSPEAIRRILKSKWRPSAAEEEDRRERWERRGESVYRRWVEERGANPPKKWRQRGIGGGPRRLSQDREYQKRITFEREGVGWREPGVETAIPWG